MEEPKTDASVKWRPQMKAFSDGLMSWLSSTESVVRVKSIGFRVEQGSVWNTCVARQVVQKEPRHTKKDWVQTTKVWMTFLSEQGSRFPTQKRMAAITTPHALWYTVLIHTHTQTSTLDTCIYTHAYRQTYIYTHRQHWLLGTPNFVEVFCRCPEV